MTFDVTTAVIFGPAGVAAGAVATWLINFGVNRSKNEQRDQAIVEFKADLADKERLLRKFYEKLGILTGEHRTVSRTVAVETITEDSGMQSMPPPPPGKKPR